MEQKPIRLSIKQAIAIFSFLAGTIVPTVYYLAQERTLQQVSTRALTARIERLEERQKEENDRLRSEIQEAKVAINRDLDRLLSVINEVIIGTEMKLEQEKNRD